MQEEKAKLYILGIVLLVAVVGIVILANFGTSDVVGYATKVKATCGDGSCARKEATSGSCPADCTTTDTDSDGLYDYQETYGLAGAITDPNDSDSDNDGLNDGQELTSTSTNPNNSDTDGDGLSDGDEVNTYGTNPNSNDTDGDTHPDSVEISMGTDPNDASDYPAPLLPDLVIDEAQTSVLFEGKVWVNNANGIVINQSMNATVNLGIKNQGTAIASGTSYNDVRLLDSGSYIALPSIPTATLSIVPGATQIVAGVDRAPLYSTTTSAVLSFLQEIYDGGNPIVTLQYRIDSATTRYITESDETNNNGNYDITLDSSMYNIQFICVEYLASGSTTYLTVVETTCT